MPWDVTLLLHFVGCAVQDEKNPSRIEIVEKRSIKATLICSILTLCEPALVNHSIAWLTCRSFGPHLPPLTFTLTALRTPPARKSLARNRLATSIGPGPVNYADLFNLGRKVGPGVATSQIRQTCIRLSTLRRPTSAL